MLFINDIVLEDEIKVRLIISENYGKLLKFKVLSLNSTKMEHIEYSFGKIKKRDEIQGFEFK